jgi:hypothetical protein
MYHEVNFIGDALTNLACDNDCEFVVVYDTCPSIVRKCFQDDFLGVSTPQLVKTRNQILHNNIMQTSVSPNSYTTTLN